MMKLAVLQSMLLQVGAKFRFNIALGDGGSGAWMVDLKDGEGSIVAGDTDTKVKYKAVVGF
jgi:hypothetical protein